VRGKQNKNQHSDKSEAGALLRRANKYR
jgi:hypothetical protein